MLSVKFSGNSIGDVARDALEFAKAILGEDKIGEKRDSWEGYRPEGVGMSEYKPVDDGREWKEAALKEWLESITEDGRKVVGILARKKIIDQRKEIEELNWDGSKWAGVWTSPRRQAGYVMESYRLSSWPYGHTYDEPRRMWMHEDIANMVINILESL